MRLRLLPLLLVLATVVFATTNRSASALNIVVSNLNDGGAGSLRQAITDANANPGADTITFTVTGTINITSAALPQITGPQSLTITGPGQSALTVQIICGGCLAFSTSTTNDVTITGLTVNGGGISSGGTGPLTLTNLAIAGGGLTQTTNSGNATLDNVTISASPNDGVRVNPGSTLTIRNSTITANPGSGISTVSGLSTSGSVTIENSTLSGNSQYGLYLDGNCSCQPSIGHVRASTISSNFAGGIYDGGSLDVTNSTISGNQAASGGGIYQIGSTHSAAAVFESTIVNNSASPGAGGGIFGKVGLSASIVANNTGGDCGTVPSSSGYNIAGDASCALSQTGDLNSTNPLVGPLANNGGPTQTHALQPGSPAIDTYACASGDVDQRGISRPRDGDANGSVFCDTGSFEAPGATPLPAPSFSKAFGAPTVGQTKTVSLTSASPTPTRRP